MSHDPNEELISAYLDGELAPDQQAKAEKLLAEKVEYRQLYEELLALRSAFQALPQHQVGEDLSRRVIQRAEQELLIGKAARTESAPQKDAAARTDAGFAHPAAPEPRRDFPILRFPRGWRPWLWPAIAAAAAIWMMVFNQAPQPQPIAKRLPGGGDAGTISARPDKDARDDRVADDAGRGGAIADRESRIRRENAESEHLAKDYSFGQPGESDKNADGERATKSRLAGRKSANLKDQTADEPGTTGRSLAKSVRAMPRAATNGEDGDQVDADRLTAYGTRSNLAFQVANGAYATAKLDELRDKLAQGETPADVIVIECLMTPEAARSGAFENLLAQNEIVLRGEEQQLEILAESSSFAGDAEGTSVDSHKSSAGKIAGVERKAEKKSAEKKSAVTAEEQAANKVAKSIEKEKGKDDADGDKLSEDDAAGVGAAAANGQAMVDAFYVDAPLVQVEAALAQLNAQSDQFRAVALQAGPAESLELFAHYRHEPAKDVREADVRELDEKKQLQAGVARSAPAPTPMPAPATAAPSVLRDEPRAEAAGNAKAADDEDAAPEVEPGASDVAWAARFRYAAPAGTQVESRSQEPAAAGKLEKPPAAPQRNQPEPPAPAKVPDSNERPAPRRDAAGKPLEAPKPSEPMPTQQQTGNRGGPSAKAPAGDAKTKLAPKADEEAKQETSRRDLSRKDAATKGAALKSADPKDAVQQEAPKPGVAKLDPANRDAANRDAAKRDSAKLGAPPKEDPQAQLADKDRHGFAEKGVDVPHANGPRVRVLFKLRIVEPE